MTPGQIWYHRVYLRSEHWQKIRAAKFKRNPVCEMCLTGRHRSVHHVSYDNLGREQMIDLITLCRRCHKLQHAAMPDVEKIAIERQIMQNAAFRKRQVARDARAKKRRRNKRKTPGFQKYASHCLRAIRGGFAKPWERNWLLRNKQAIANLTF